MEEIKLSVIIPIYNTEQYLEQCINSVLEQTYSNIEVILVNDGSSDNSALICDRYAVEYDTVKVVHKKNGGSSDARNAGINKATGDYILFLDSDDFWNDSMAVQKLVNRIIITDADVLNFSYIKYFENEGVLHYQFQNISPMPNTMSGKEEQLNYIVGNSLYIASACNKLIKRSVLNEDMFFLKGKQSEDIEWCARLLEKANSFDFICENFYCYRQREGSISHTIAEKSCRDLTFNIVTCVALADNGDNITKKYLYMYTAYQLSTFFAVQAYAQRCPRECMITLNKYRWILKYHGSNRKITCLYIGCKLIGFYGMCWLTKKLKRIWG